MNATQLLEHFDRLAEAPDAVPRLRQLVLELAVRGKLVEQDRTDEPVATQLKDIRAARAIRIGDPTPRARKVSNQSASNALQFALPLGWSVVSLAELTDVLNGRAYAKNELLSAGTPVLRVGNLFTSKNWYYSNLTLEEDKYCDKGDLIFSWSASFGPFIWTGPKVIYHYHIWKLRLHSEARLDKNYLYRFLLQQTQQIKASGHGVSMIHMTKEKMERLLVPLPPLAEQHRIVAKVDELMALCDQLEAAQQERESRRDRLAAASLQRLNQPAADTTPEAQREHARFHLQHLPRLTTRPVHIKAMRQLLVNLAVVGKLAPPEPNDEPAEVLLKKVWAEKKSRGLLKQAKESREGNIDLTVNSLPAGWAWTTFESFATEIATGPFGSALHQSDYIDGGIPLVNPSHMIDGRIVANPKISVTAETANGLASYRMKSGDVVMARRGEVGRAAIVTDAEAGWLCGTGSFFVSFHEEIDRQFVILLLRSDAVRRYLAGEAVGTTMVNLNHGILKRIPLALPPAAEQHRIVAKIDELMALCDQLEAHLTTTQTDSRRLLEAVLEAALAPA